MKLFIEKIMKNSLTDIGIQRALSDWDKLNKSLNEHCVKSENR